MNHYRVLSILGTGGMGEVYLAEDLKLGRKIALKLLPAQFSTDSERKARFIQEARAASALNHPNIITIYGVESDENFDFIATELVDGKTLRELIGEKPFDWREIVEIAMQMASALGAAHDAGIVHRDIKPANIMLRRDNLVKILDFGLAKLTMPTADSSNFETRDNTAPNRVMGTINYMSPEQALGEKIDARTDIFSLGVVLYEMLSGKQPFAGPSDAAIFNQTINKNPPPLSESNHEIPAEFDRIIRRAMEKNPERRYQTANDLRLDLQTLKQFSDDGLQLRKNSFSANRFPSSPASDAANARFSFGEKLVYPLVASLVLAVSVIVYFAFFAENTKTIQLETAKNFNFSQFTGDGNAVLPSLSPDGKTVVFSSRQSGNWDVYFQRVGGANAINLTKDSPADDFQAVYS
ncbi:MAG TPA: protein kinase, partial [Pyrinomonadaceae bacterium]|nr:protein kinase [Pyrinomonadaceae bacterium]